MRSLLPLLIITSTTNAEPGSAEAGMFSDMLVFSWLFACPWAKGRKIRMIKAQSA